MASQNEFPLTIKVDYQIKEETVKLIEPYRRIIQQLYENELPVNNSFAHVYRYRNEASILDGGQIGSWISLQSKNILKHYITHAREHCLNHIMDVFCADSIQRRFLSEEKLKKLTEIIGPDRVWTVKDSIVFSLPNIEYITSSYRITNVKLIKKIQKLLL